MVASTMRFQGKAQQQWVDKPASDVVYAFENVGSIEIGSAERPLLSSPDGTTYTCFVNDNPQRLCFSSVEVTEFFRDDHVQVVFAGYWYKKGLIQRFDNDGHETNEYRNFRKRLTRTENILAEAFEANAASQATAERVEIPVPTVDWRFTLKMVGWTAFLVYVMAIISLMIVR